MLSTEFEAASPEIKQLQTYALDSRATGIGKKTLFLHKYYYSCFILLRYVACHSKRRGRTSL